VKCDPALTGWTHRKEVSANRNFFPVFYFLEKADAAAGNDRPVKPVRVQKLRRKNMVKRVIFSGVAAAFFLAACPAAAEVSFDRGVDVNYAGFFSRYRQT